jgi:predicted Rossmann fold flavoprotein
MKTKDILIIGGGPAGMMAAIRAAQLKKDVLLIEKNAQLGRKLLLTGKGRCNLTNIADVETFLEKFSPNGQFLRDAFKVFFNRQLMDFFESKGLKLEVERQGRVSTDKATSILEVLTRELHINQVELLLGARVKDILIDEKKVQAVELADKRQILCTRVIIATGGVSYGFTGSTGDGINFAETLGHRIVPLRPGLVPLETKETFVKKLEGLTLKNIRLIFTDGKKKIVSPIGELLFTDFGISGPLVLTLSGQITDWVKEGRRVAVEIDLKPALSAQDLDNRLLREIQAAPQKIIKNVLKNLLPQKLIGIFIRLVDIGADKHVSHLTQKERGRVCELLKAFRLEIKGPRPIRDAMVTQGGVSLKDIDPRTMESRLMEGLYFAGEMIDMAGDTGGFNLQAAFSTGYLAGEAAAKK